MGYPKDMNNISNNRYFYDYLEFRVLANIKDCGEGTHFCTDVFALRVDEATIQGSTNAESELPLLIFYRGGRRKVVLENSKFCTVFCCFV